MGDTPVIDCLPLTRDIHCLLTCQPGYDIFNKNGLLLNVEEVDQDVEALWDAVFDYDLAGFERHKKLILDRAEARGTEFYRDEQTAVESSLDLRRNSIERKMSAGRMDRDSAKLLKDQLEADVEERLQELEAEHKGALERIATLRARDD